MDEKTILIKYKENYNIDKKMNLTIEDVKNHLKLETELTRRLLNSRKENRAETYISCYTELYEKIYWLNENDNQKEIDKRTFTPFIKAMDKPPRKVLEIGSGKAELITYLAKLGYDCKGTEITETRGKKFSQDTNIQWGITDGVNLLKYESSNYYDYVISNQVIEHLHPEDIIGHFNSIRAILKPGGKYIFNTPHRYTGPHDISKIFGYKKTIGMHLKEYSFNEIITLLQKIGYKNIYTPNYDHLITKCTKNKKLKLYISIILIKMIQLLEKVFWIVPRPLYKKLFSSVFIVAEK